MPLPVTPKRFWAPLWLFILGTCLSLLLPRAPTGRPSGSGLAAGVGAATGSAAGTPSSASLLGVRLGTVVLRRGAVIFGLCVDVTTIDIERAFQDRLALDVAVLRDQLREACQEVPPDVGVADLAASELDGDLDPVALLQEVDGAADLGVEVTLADLDA